MGGLLQVLVAKLSLLQLYQNPLDDTLYAIRRRLIKEKQQTCIYNLEILELEIIHLPRRVRNPPQIR